MSTERTKMSEMLSKILVIYDTKQFYCACFRITAVKLSLGKPCKAVQGRYFIVSGQVNMFECLWYFLLIIHIFCSPTQFSGSQL